MKSAVTVGVSLHAVLPALEPSPARDPSHTTSAREGGAQWSRQVEWYSCIGPDLVNSPSTLAEGEAECWGAGVRREQSPSQSGGGIGRVDSES
jgi:hypothetical protein